jgi:hypothetical protein
MKKMSISRRSFVKLFAGLSAGATAQLTGLFRGAWVASAADMNPLRLIVITQPHANTKYWVPRMPDGSLAAHNSTGWTLAYDTKPTDLQPMEKHKDSLVIIDGLDFYCLNKPGASGISGHDANFATLTGTDAKSTVNTTPQGPSIDIALADFLNVKPKVFRFYEAQNSWDHSGDAFGAVTPLFSNDTSVVQAYNSLFSTLSSGTSPDPKAAARLAAQRSVLNYLNDETKSIRNRLAPAEKIKLDQHLDTLSLIEKDLMPSTPGVSCSKPTQPSGPDDDRAYLTSDYERYPFINAYIATLFACNMTRVAAFHMNSQEMDWLSYNGVPLDPDTHNNVIHKMDLKNDDSIRRNAVVHNWYASQVSALCDMLKTVDDGNGKTAYDNTIIVWTNGLGDPVNHLPYDVPFVLAGGGGKWAKGRYLNYGNSKRATPTEPGTTDDTNPHNGVLVSVLNEFGMNISSFGDPAFTGGLTGLL